MKVTILGSGTSTGVPVPGCHCSVCTSGNSRNKRLRTSAFIQIHSRDLTSSDIATIANTDANEVVANILIDTSPDLRYQSLRSGIKRIDAVLYTHAHADHIFGLDDLRGFSFSRKDSIHAYASKQCQGELRRIFQYIFDPDPNYQGGAPPKLILEELFPLQPLDLFGFSVLPLPALHGTTEVYGFRFGKFAYLTDCSYIPDETLQALEGLDVVVLNALRYRPHPTHFNHDQAIHQLEKIKPKKSYLIHISHDTDQDEGNSYLAKNSSLDIELAYDGLEIQL